MLRQLAATLVNRPISLVMGAVTMGGMVALADPAFGRWRVPMGLMHGLAHVVCAFLVAWGSIYFTVSTLGICASPPESVPASWRRRSARRGKLARSMRRGPHGTSIETPAEEYHIDAVPFQHPTEHVCEV